MEKRPVLLFAEWNFSIFVGFFGGNSRQMVSFFHSQMLQFLVSSVGLYGSRGLPGRNPEIGP